MTGRRHLQPWNGGMAEWWNGGSFFPFRDGRVPGHFHRRVPNLSEPLSSLSLKMVRRRVPMRDPRRLEGSPNPREVILI